MRWLKNSVNGPAIVDVAADPGVPSFADENETYCSKLLISDQ